MKVKDISESSLDLKMKRKIVIGLLILAILGAAVFLNLFPREERIPRLTETWFKNKIIFASGENIVMANEDGSNPMIITRGKAPAFSPDGKKLAFLRVHEMCLIEFEKGSITKLLNDVLILEFKFSPDSQKIAFTSVENNGNSLSVIDLASKKILKLTEGWKGIYRISWSPDGTQIVFGDIKSEKIFIINIDGTNLTELTEGREPIWSPKEAKIAFIRYYGTEKEVTTELFVMDLNTKNIIKIAENADYPYWSPDGKKIAFISFIDRISRILVADIETGNVTELTKGDSDVLIFGPLVWSADGKKIAFQMGGPRFNKDMEIYLVNIENKEIKNISNNPKAYDVQPCFPPF